MQLRYRHGFLLNFFLLETLHRPKQGFFSQARDALDFAEVRSESDAQLLYNASKRKKGERLSPEEAL